VLDSPSHPAPGECFVGIAATSDGDPVGVFDGGCPHYDGGGVLRRETAGETHVELAGGRVGTARGRDVDWDDFSVLANGREIPGVSLFCAQDERFGAKLICPDVDFAVGERVRVEIA
jgi:hypothetical protein